MKFCSCYHRYGQLLSSLLPRDHFDENPISLYDQSPPQVKRGGVDIDEGGLDSKESENDEVPPPNKLTEETKIHSSIRRRIRLRNHLFDVLMSHLTTETNEFDIKCVPVNCLLMIFDHIILPSDVNYNFVDAAAKVSSL